jgi:hypothetical protein
MGKACAKEEDKKEDAIQTNDKKNVLKNSTFPSDPSSSIPLQKSKTLVEAISMEICPKLPKDIQR